MCLPAWHSLRRLRRRIRGTDLTGCGAPTGSDVRGGSTLPVHAAIRKGIFERNGLRIELTEGQDLPVFMAALAKGQYDIVMSGPTLVLIGVEKGLDLQIISSLQRSSRERPNAVWITKDRRSIRLANSRERRSAVPSLTGIIADTNRVPAGPRGMDRDDDQVLPDSFRDHGRSTGGRPCRGRGRVHPLQRQRSPHAGFGSTTTSSWRRCERRAGAPFRPR